MGHLRHFQSLLIVITTKTTQIIDETLPQLLAYLACLRQSRLQRSRKDGSVYGVMSNGFMWTFVTITHIGTVKISRMFNLLHGLVDMQRVLACLQYILETATGMSPNVTPEKDGWGGEVGSDENWGGEDITDPAIDLDDHRDHDYMHPDTS
jgi:hypothetical protein